MEAKEEEFIINRDELWKTVYEYRENPLDKNIDEYINQVAELLGNNAFRDAFNDVDIKNIAKRFLNNENHDSYSFEEELDMLEGVSNYKIIGDWQYYLTINTDYIFKLPVESQEKFAENFSIGNDKLKNCLLTLWENKIDTTGVDIKRDSCQGSTNYIAFNVSKKFSMMFTEVIARNSAKNSTFMFCNKNSIDEGDIVAIFSENTNIFNDIARVAPVLRKVITNERIDEMTEIENNYWDKCVKSAEIDGVGMNQYMGLSHIKNSKIRMKEERHIIEGTSNLSIEHIYVLRDRIKNIPQSVFKKISDIFASRNMKQVIKNDIELEK